MALMCLLDRKLLHEGIVAMFESLRVVNRQSKEMACLISIVYNLDSEPVNQCFHDLIPPIIQPSRCHGLLPIARYSLVCSSQHRSNAQSTRRSKPNSLQDVFHSHSRSAGQLVLPHFIRYPDVLWQHVPMRIRLILQPLKVIDLIP